MQEKYKWYLVASLCVIVVGVCIIGFVSSDDKDEDTQKPKIVLRSNTPALKPDEIRKHIEDAKTYEPPNPNQHTLDVIESYRSKIEESPDDSETPALLEAMGNLYAYKLGDFEMAASCYDQLLHRYPNHNRQRTYVNLLTSFEKSGDIEGATRVCREIRKEFPEDSEVFQWAVEKVRKDIWEMSATVPETLPVETNE